jgi:hypothetical protein
MQLMLIAFAGLAVSSPDASILFISASFIDSPSITPSGSVSASAGSSASLSASPAPSASPSLSPNVTSLFVASSAGCNDSGVCAATAPCCSLMYAVERVAAFMLPLDAFVPIVVEAGEYGVTSCGVRTQRPLAVRGVGAVGAVVFDCAGSDRVLSSSSSLVLANVTLQGGRVSDGSNGGAVSVECGDASASYVFEGVVFRNNSVLNGNGGALSINVTNSVASAGVSVWLHGTLFQGNTATCDAVGCPASDDPISADFANGGGLFIVIDAPVVTSPSITLTDCLISGNSAVVPESTCHSMSHCCDLLCIH